jgi:hypothetical protein
MAPATAHQRGRNGRAAAGAVIALSYHTRPRPATSGELRNKHEGIVIVVVVVVVAAKDELV